MISTIAGGHLPVSAATRQQPSLSSAAAWNCWEEQANSIFTPKEAGSTQPTLCLQLLHAPAPMEGRDRVDWEPTLPKLNGWLQHLQAETMSCT